jgi:hypothetical protein
MAGAAALAALLGFLAAPGPSVPLAQGAPASSYDPARLRQALLSIHGFSKEALEAATTNAPDVLMLLAADPEEEMAVRRQAVKALRFYPEDGVMSFIEQQAPSAPRGLKRLYLSSLGGFVTSHPERVSVMAAAALEDADRSIRLDALKVADRLGARPEVRAMLQSRLAREADPGLRLEIQRRLGSN